MFCMTPINIGWFITKLTLKVPGPVDLLFCFVFFVANFVSKFGPPKSSGDHIFVEPWPFMDPGGGFSRTGVAGKNELCTAAEGSPEIDVRVLPTLPSKCTGNRK